MIFQQTACLFLVSQSRYTLPMTNKPERGLGREAPFPFVGGEIRAGLGGSTAGCSVNRRPGWPKPSAGCKTKGVAKGDSLCFL